jgi:hypothetical protein
MQRRGCHGASIERGQDRRKRHAAVSQRREWECGNQVVDLGQRRERVVPGRVLRDLRKILAVRLAEYPTGSVVAGALAHRAVGAQEGALALQA